MWRCVEGVENAGLGSEKLRCLVGGVDSLWWRSNRLVAQRAIWTKVSSFRGGFYSGEWRTYQLVQTISHLIPITFNEPANIQIAWRRCWLFEEERELRWSRCGEQLARRLGRGEGGLLAAGVSLWSYGGDSCSRVLK